MIDLGTHWEYIAGGYLAAAAVVLVLVVWTVTDGRRQKARVAELEARRLARASARPSA